MKNRPIDYSKPVNNREINGVIVFEDRKDIPDDVLIGCLFFAQDSKLSKKEQYEQCFDYATKQAFELGFKYLYILTRYIPDSPAQTYGFAASMHKEKGNKD